MTESSLFWTGEVTGDAGPYSADTFTDWLRTILLTDPTKQGVIYGYLNELEVTNPASTTIQTASGAAIIDGNYYKNTGNITDTVVAPGSGSNFYRIVLRKSFAAQTVRVEMIGPDTVSFPALTQNDGTTWEISLAGIEIDSLAAITITDEREYAYSKERSVFVPGDFSTIDYTTSGTDVKLQGMQFIIPDDYHKDLRINLVASVTPGSVGDDFAYDQRLKITYSVIDTGVITQITPDFTAMSFTGKVFNLFFDSLILAYIDIDNGVLVPGDWVALEIQIDNWVSDWTQYEFNLHGVRLDYTSFR